MSDQELIIFVDRTTPLTPWVVCSGGSTFRFRELEIRVPIRTSITENAAGRGKYAMTAVGYLEANQVEPKAVIRPAAFPAKWGP